MAKRGFSVQKSPKKQTCPTIRDAVRVARRASSRSKLASGGLVVVVLALGAFGWWRSGAQQGRGAQVTDAVESIGDIGCLHHPYTGVCVAKLPEVLPRVAAVMVENSADAWPLSGVNGAFLVVEAPAEGDIPRFVTFFSEDSQVKEIGPVRSARLYYLSYASPFHALYAHVGGSPEALDNLKNFTALTDFDQFFRGSYFVRDARRSAPHNVYTSSKDLASAFGAYSVPLPTVSPLVFGSAPTGGVSTSTLNVDWTAGSTYDITWRYVPADNKYERLNAAGQSVILRDGATIAASNVIVVESQMSVIDEKLRKKIQVLGTGKALMVRDGKSWSGTWSRATDTDFWQFKTNDGQTFNLAPGSTWVEVVSDIGHASVTASNAEETRP